MPRRSVRYEPSYEHSLRELREKDVRRLDELCGGAIYQIEEDAESCEHMGDGPLWLARTQIGPGEDIYRVYFTINSDGQCSLWHVDCAPDEDWEVDGGG